MQREGIGRGNIQRDYENADNPKKALSDLSAASSQPPQEQTQCVAGITR